MQRFQFHLDLKIKDYLYLSLLLLKNPIIQVGYLAASVVLAWFVTTTANWKGVFPFIALIAGFYFLDCVVYVLESCIRRYKNGITIMKSLDYQSSEITQDSIVNIYMKSHSTIKWRDMEKIKEYKHYFLLCLSRKNISILPKRCLSKECVQLVRKITHIHRQGIKNNYSEALPVPGIQSQIEKNAHNFTVILQSQDGIALQLYHTYVYRRFYIILSGIILFAAIYTGLIGKFLYATVYLVILIIAHAMELIHAFSYGTQYRKQPREIRYSLSEQSLEVTNHLGSFVYEWNKLHYIGKTKKHYYVYISKMHALIIPRREISLQTMNKIDYYTRQYNLNHQNRQQDGNSNSSPHR